MAKNDKAKSILGGPPKGNLLKKEVKKDYHHSLNKKSQPKRSHFSHHCGIARHTHPNCYKWLSNQKNNGVLNSRGQNLHQDYIPLFGELLKALLSKFQ